MASFPQKINPVLEWCLSFISSTCFRAEKACISLDGLYSAVYRAVSSFYRWGNRGVEIRHIWAKFSQSGRLEREFTCTLSFPKNLPKTKPEWKVEWVILTSPSDLPSYDQSWTTQRRIQLILSPQGNFNLEMTISFSMSVLFQWGFHEWIIQTS